MLIEDIKKVIPSKLDVDAKKVYDKLKEKSNNFDPEFLIVYQNLEEAVQEFVDVVKEKYPDAIRIVKKREPKEKPPVPETDNKEVIEAMKDYNLSQEKAERLIKLRHEASEARKESLDKMLDTLRKSDFYDERSTSKRQIDKNRSRDLGKDTNRGSITFKDEIRMTGRPFKRISKNGKTYYEYRLNRRDIDHKIRLAKGGMTEHGLREGDKIIFDRLVDDNIDIIDRNGMKHIVDLNKGKRYAKGGGTSDTLQEWVKMHPIEKQSDNFFRLYYTKNNFTLKQSKKESELVKYRKELYDLHTKYAKYAKGGGVDKLPTNLKNRLDNANKIIVNYGGRPITVIEAISFNSNQKPQSGYNGGFKAFELSNANYADYRYATKKELQTIGDALIDISREMSGKDIYAKGGGVSIPNAEKMFHLPYELAVYVPSTKDVDKNITASELRARVKEVEKYLAEIFGGFTSSEKVGGYLSSKSSVVTEKVIPVTSFATMEAFRAKKATLVNKMSVWAKKWGQEAIGFEFEGDLYYVPQKFKQGGQLKATYIPKRDIKMLTTVWGNNIKGKDLIDGAYTKRKNIKTAPKVARTQFEDETFEFAKGGQVGQNLEFEYMGDPMTGEVIEIIDSGDFIVRSGTRTILVDPMNVTKYGETPKKSRFGFFKKGGKTKKPMVVRYYFEDEEFEYAKGGHIEEEIDLFEDYENIPDNVQAILEKHEDDFETGNYKGLEKALKEMNKIGYTFDYYLDGQAYNLRPMGSKGKHE